MIVALLRHAPTAWNAAGRLQGRADVPLSAPGRATAAQWRAPPGFERAHLVASPLVRAVETARLLGGRDPVLVPELVEMDWGAWEGKTFDALRTEHAAAFAEAEAAGLDFRPPGGESYRDVQQRLLGWLAASAASPGPVLAVTHKGVLNALVAHVTGWNAIGRPPVKPRTGHAQVVDVHADGRVVVRAWNVPLAVPPLA